VLVIFGGLLLVMLLAALDSTRCYSDDDACSLPDLQNDNGDNQSDDCAADVLLGTGLGFVMQMLIIAVQNAVDYHDLGVATSNAAWLLVQIEREPGLDVHELGRKGKVDHGKVEEAKAELLDKSSIAPASATDVYRLTNTGCETYNRLATARREHLAELWPEWSPKKREEVAATLRNLARELIPESKAA